MKRFSISRCLRLSVALLLFAFFTPVQAEKCFGAAGQQCGMFAGGELGRVAFCYGNGSSATCDVHGGSWTHDECCAANPNGKECGGNNSSSRCTVEWDRAVSRWFWDYHWVRVVNTSRVDTDGKVNRGEYCARPGSGLHRDDRQYCCSGRSYKAHWPLNLVRWRLYFCE